MENTTEYTLENFSNDIKSLIEEGLSKGLSIKDSAKYAKKESIKSLGKKTYKHWHREFANAGYILMINFDNKTYAVELS